MKKLMITLAAAAMAVASQAATVSWVISNVKDASGNGLTSGYSYVFFADSAATATSSIEAIKALAGKGASAFATTLASANWNGVKKATAAGNFSMGSSAALGGYSLPSNADLGLEGSTSYTAYAVIFDTTTVTDSSKFIVTSTATASTLADSASQNKQFSIGSQSSNTSWAAVGVPEPTSGLLLLLGMAGLALKRKIA